MTDRATLVARLEWQLARVPYNGFIHLSEDEVREAIAALTAPPVPDTAAALNAPFVPEGDMPEHLLDAILANIARRDARADEWFTPTVCHEANLRLIKAALRRAAPAVAADYRQVCARCGFIGVGIGVKECPNCGPTEWRAAPAVGSDVERIAQWVRDQREDDTANPRVQQVFEVLASGIRDGAWRAAPAGGEEERDETLVLAEHPDISNLRDLARELAYRAQRIVGLEARVAAARARMETLRRDDEWSRIHRDDYDPQWNAAIDACLTALEPDASL